MTAGRPAIGPDALGLGYRPAHLAGWLEGARSVDFAEVIAENVLSGSPLPLHQLDRLAERYPIVLHGVSLDLLGADPLDRAHLRALRDLVRRYQVPFVTEHLCWSASGGRHHHDLLPAPMHPDLIPYAAARAAWVQDVLEVPLGLENLSAYLTWDADVLDPWTFAREVIERASCHLLLDVHNLAVSAFNHGFDALRALADVPVGRVLQIHLAGHRPHPSGLRVDTHDAPVPPEVWDLYRAAWQHLGPTPTSLEWDDHLPAFDEAVRAVRLATEVRA
jgi:uncharacterized protein (UPF0276 family)